MKSLDSQTPNQDWHPNIWPPFTQINNSKPQIEVTHGKDALLFTKNPKKELIDAISSWWVTLHGHSNQYIADAIFKATSTAVEPLSEKNNRSSFVNSLSLSANFFACGCKKSANITCSSFFD